MLSNGNKIPVTNASHINNFKFSNTYTKSIKVYNSKINFNDVLFINIGGHGKRLSCQHKINIKVFNFTFFHI